MRFFDSHAHLQDEDYDNDRAEMLARAVAAGVDRVLLATASLDDSEAAVRLASQDERLVCSVGCHPHEASKYGPDGTDRLRRLIDQYRGRPIVAIGEAGLDYHYDYSPRPVQQDVFRQQCSIWPLSANYR